MSYIYPRRLWYMYCVLLNLCCIEHSSYIVVGAGFCSGEPTIGLRHNQSFMQPILSTVNQYEPTNMIYANISWLQRGWQPVAARGLLRRKIPWWWPNLLLKWVTALIFPGGRRGICMSKALSGKGGKQAYFTIQSDQVVKIKLRPIYGRQTDRKSVNLLILKSGI